MLLIIFGAGASYDNFIEIQASNSPKLPLTNDLINRDLQYVQQAMTKWPGAVPLLNRLNTLKNIKNKDESNFNLEEALYLELERNNNAVQNQLLSFRFYIHDVIRNCEERVRSVNQGNTNYTRLLNMLQLKGVDQKMGISLVTFNYDTLLETACTQLYPDWEFGNFEDYIKGCSMVRLYKPHGSLGWKQSYQMTHQPTKVGVVKILANSTNFDLKPTVQQIDNYYQEYDPATMSNYASEPILALPYKQKTTFVFPDSHKQALVQDIGKITHILTIGWRGTEEHFYKDVINKVPESTNLKILNVNTGGTEIEHNLKENLGNKIEEIHTFGGKFSTFLDDDKELDKFILS